MKPPERYTRNGELNLFCREGFQGIPYADGGEQRLYEAVRAAADRSTFSRELAHAINDWPSEYHLSSGRHCLVRGLGIKPGDKILELGCGCGAITRFLGEAGAEVTAVEGSFHRARVAAERCHDLAKVRVVVEDLLQFQTTERFEWVLLVGVVEYAPVFSAEPEPVAHYLRNAAQFLAEKGKLLIAIENKLGLKYFNGLAEDHLGIPYYGVQGLYGARTPRTFGRLELRLQIASAGLDHLEFYYPFPDYKLPRVILSERALCDDAFDPSDLLATIAPRDYARHTHRHFDDALTMSEVARNGLLADLSNSFLVVAARHPFSSDDSELAVSFTPGRLREFATQTRFVRTSRGIQVIKESLEPVAVRQTKLTDGSTLENVLGVSDYVSGRLLFWRLSVARAKQGGLAEMVEALRPWFEFLLSQVDDSESAKSQRLANLALAGRFLDLTPFNLIDAGHELIPIDQEWVVDRDIPLGWVVTRSIFHSLVGVTGFEKPGIKIVDVIRILCSEYGLSVSDAEIENWLRLSAEIKAVVMGVEPEEIPLDVTSSASLPLHQVAGGHNAQPELGHIIAGGEAQIAALNRDVAERETQIAFLNRVIAERNAQADSLSEIAVEAQVALICKSGLFDRDWYLRNNPDVAAASIDPVRHYVLHGGAEGRDPSLFFNTRAYLAANPKITTTEINPLVHYIARFLLAVMSNAAIKGG